jgi:replication factor A1
MSYEEREPIEATVAELKPQMRNVTISFKVVEIGDGRDVTSRKDNSEHRVVDVVVGDSTGIIRMPLWDDAIEMVDEEKTYVLTNGYTGLFRGNLQLSVGRYGNLAESEEEIAEVNMDIDMSAKEYEDMRYRRRDNRDGDGYRRERRSYRDNSRNYRSY